MAYAIVSFTDNDDVSEIPTNWLQKENTDDLLCWWPPANVKNFTSFISKRTEPDIKTWSLLPVKLEKYCSTLQKARKAAEDENYTSTDETQLGRGCRKKLPNNKYIHSESDSEDENANNSDQSKGQEMPKWPESVNENNSFPSTSSSTNNQEKHSNPVQEPIEETLSIQNTEGNLSQSSITQTQEEIKNAPIEILIDEPIQEALLIANTEANTRTLMKMIAEIQLQIKDVIQRIDRITSTVKIVSSIEEIKKYLPLKSIEDIRNIETRLKEENFVNEYKTFIRKVGGHTHRENIRNALARIFSNECSMKCSWKGRRENFAVHRLGLITIMKEIIMESHVTLTERELDDIAAEWFRFAKQRHERESKN